MKLKAYAISDIGQKRALNQDSYLINKKSKLFIVADGMGGHKGGEVASALAVQAIDQFVEANKSKYKKRPKELINEAMHHANKRIVSEGRKNKSLKGMGTTVTMILINAGKAIIANVGDSRVYLMSNNNIWQITEDHSAFEEQKRAGLLSKSKGHRGNWELKGILTRSVGVDDQLDVDLFEKKLENGDTFFLCSDGLHNYIPDMEIKNTISKSGLEDGVNELIALANNRGGDDNITALCVEVGK